MYEKSKHDIIIIGKSIKVKYMTKRLTIEEFNQIKKLMHRMHKRYMNLHATSKYYGLDKNEVFELKKLYDKMINMQNLLFSYDLSDIPANEWRGMIIDVGHSHSFNGTNANIDFKVLPYTKGIGYKSCRIENADALKNVMLDTRDFDDEFVNDHPNYFAAFKLPVNMQEKIYNGNFTVEDFLALSDDIRDSLIKCLTRNEFETKTRNVVDIMGVSKTVELYQNSKDDYDSICGIIDYVGTDITSKWHFEHDSITEIKNKIYNYVRNYLLNSDVSIDISKLPMKVVMLNRDILLLNDDIPVELKARYYAKDLTADDIVNNISLFRNISIKNFTSDDKIIKVIDAITGVNSEQIGDSKFKEYVSIYPEIFTYILKTPVAYNLNDCGLNDLVDIDYSKDAKKQVKDFLYKNIMHYDHALEYPEQLLLYQQDFFELPQSQNNVIQKLGIDNIKRFEKETGFFSQYPHLKMFSLFEEYLCGIKYEKLCASNISFEDGKLSYNDFLNEIARCLDYMRKDGAFAGNYMFGNTYPDYDFIKGDFRDKHPEIFISNDAPEFFRTAFYKDNITPEFLQKNNQYIHYLEDKNLVNTIRADIKLIWHSDDKDVEKNFIEEYVSRYGNRKLLDLFVKYGIIMGYSRIEYPNDFDNNIESAIRKAIFKKIDNGAKEYQYLSSIPEVLEERPDLFLSDDAPEELKRRFYGIGSMELSFMDLHNHPEWKPYLEGKNLLRPLLIDHHMRASMMEYFDKFGVDKGIRLGIARAETITEMLRNNKVELMRLWYEKTGCKFIPDVVIMQNFNLDEADQFLLSGSCWSNLMRIKNFSDDIESREAMMKLAYSFGVFNHDKRGYTKLMNLLIGLPRKVDGNVGTHVFDRLDETIDSYTKRQSFFAMKTLSKEQAYERMLQYLHQKNTVATMTYGSSITIDQFLNVLREENVPVDYSKNIFKQIYKKVSDDLFVLTLDQQSYPKTTNIIRLVLEQYVELNLLTPDKAHQLFGGFSLKYDADFREFLLSNIDAILEDPTYATYITSIQKQFNEIKTANSNRGLTLDLAVSYVMQNKYQNIEVGNERVAEVSAIAGYTEKDFDTLQKIYNYGKQRIFSSIPRVENVITKHDVQYKYEILRLDDPLAMAIGTLTNCCQEIDNNAETTMEHSMVDKHGRVFVIKDELGNIIAQSWVWRNKDVICFDNIEIPDRAFIRAIKKDNLGKDNFTEDVFEIYKQAAHELILQDDAVYKKLLNEGKITHEQYNSLRLGKVTVGLGYNDIATAITSNLKRDIINPARPLPFTAPVELEHPLYTKDSTTQYVFEERSDRKDLSGETLAVHSDTYTEYDDSNFRQEYLVSLSNLEQVTKGYSDHFDYIDDEYVASGRFVSAIADNYGLDIESTHIIMHPNFAIVYALSNDTIKIGDLLYNTIIDNDEQTMNIEDKVAMQIKLAIEQISNGKCVDVSSLDKKQKLMYEKAMNLDDDMERGVKRAK